MTQPTPKTSEETPEPIEIGNKQVAPLLDSARVEGALREAAGRRGAHIPIYEAGEPLRFDEQAIESGI